MRKTCGLFAIVVVLAMSGCGGSSDQQVTVSGINSAMSRVSTARVSGTETVRGGAGATMTGEIDFAHDSGRMHGELNGGGQALKGLPIKVDPSFDMIHTDHKTYVRGLVFPSSAGWCSSDNPETLSQSLGVDPLSPLSTLHAPARLQRVGTEMRRGVNTTRYHVVGATAYAGSGTIDDIWVDGDRRLRAIHISMDDDQSEMMDLYDYGANIKPIAAPPTSSKCGG